MYLATLLDAVTCLVLTQGRISAGAQHVMVSVLFTMNLVVDIGPSLTCKITRRPLWPLPTVPIPCSSMVSQALVF